LVEGRGNEIPLLVGSAQKNSCTKGGMRGGRGDFTRKGGRGRKKDRFIPTARRGRKGEKKNLSVGVLGTGHKKFCKRMP